MNKYDECVHYYLNNNRLIVDRDGLVTEATPDELIISDLIFNIFDNDIDVLPANEIQPLITLKLKVESNSPGIYNRPIILQTTISSRYYE